MLEALADLVATLPGGDWLLAPLDVTRPHELDWNTKWHGRVMTLAWAILLPIGVLIARFGKITPRQNWPDRLDNRLWFHTHWMMQTGAALGMVIGIYLIWKPAGDGWLIFVHRSLGWAIAAFCAMQVVAGMFRGTRRRTGPPGTGRLLARRPFRHDAPPPRLRDPAQDGGLRGARLCRRVHRHGAVDRQCAQLDVADPVALVCGTDRGLHRPATARIVHRHLSGDLGAGPATAGQPHHAPSAGASCATHRLPDTANDRRAAASSASQTPGMASGLSVSAALSGVSVRGTPVKASNRRRM